MDELALEYLKKRKPENKILNVREENIVLRWTEPNYELDGLIYDESENTFYVIVKDNFSDDDEKRIKVEEYLVHFRNFIMGEKPSCHDCRRKIRKWSEFFDPVSGIIIRSDEKKVYTKIFVLNRIE